MNNDPRHPGDAGELEQQMLEHYRRHATQEPSSALDARILAAAQAHIKAQAPAREPWLNRLHAWLFAGSARGRLSVAFASLAVIGLGVGLSMRTLERVPGGFDDSMPMMAPAAPVAAESAAVDAAPGQPMEKKRAAQPAAYSSRDHAVAAKPAPRPAAPADISGRLAEQAEPALAPAPVASAPAPFASKAEAQVLAQGDEAQLQRDLRQILKLQRSGSPELAEQQLKTLQQLHPGRDLAAELRRLQGSAR